jgi:hypothetical protein
MDIHKNPASQRRALFIMQANSGSHTALLENAGTPQGLNLQLDPHKQPRLSGRPNRLLDARGLHTIFPSSATFHGHDARISGDMRRQVRAVGPPGTVL